MWGQGPRARRYAEAVRLWLDLVPECPANAVCWLWDKGGRMTPWQLWGFYPAPDAVAVVNVPPPVFVPDPLPPAPGWVKVSAVAATVGDPVARGNALWMYPEI